MASQKAALGRGLKALLRSEEAKKDKDEQGGEEEENDLSKSRLYRFEDHKRTVGKVAEVEVANVRPNPYQPRKDFSEEAMEELADSITQLGVIQPITVRAVQGENNQYEIISGERRLRAARRADLERVPAYIREASSEQMLEMALVENVQREELNPVEVALGYQRLIDECGLTQADVAKKVGKSRTTVSNLLRLLKLPPRIQASLRDRTVSVGHARALITVDDPEEQYRFLEETIDEDLSVREVERRVRAWQEKLDTDEEDKAPETTADQEPEPPPEREDLQLEMFTDRLRSLLSTRVDIQSRTDGSGTIEVEFYSEEDLERLLELILDE